MSKPTFGNETTAEIVGAKRRWTAAEKLRMIRESMEPGNSVSVTARKYGIYPNLLYRWKRQMTDGGEVAVEANDHVVSMTEFRSLQKKVRQLEKVLGRKTLENEILKEAVRIGREKKLISRKPLQGIEDFQ